MVPTAWYTAGIYLNSDFCLSYISDPVTDSATLIYQSRRIFVDITTENMKQVICSYHIKFPMIWMCVRTFNILYQFKYVPLYNYTQILWRISWRTESFENFKRLLWIKLIYVCSNIQAKLWMTMNRSRKVLQGHLRLSLVYNIQGITILSIWKNHIFFSTMTFYKNLNLFCIWVAARGSHIETSMIDRS